MTTRPVPLEAGNAWILRRPGDGLSRDLRHNQRVLITQVDGQGEWAFIRDNSGKQRRIPVKSLDAGREYQGRSGHWYSEDHPRVRAALKKRIAELEIERGQAVNIQRIREVLDRLETAE